MVFVGMLLSTRLRVPLAPALAAGGILLNLWVGLSFGDTLGHFVDALLAGELWLLLAITVLIIEIGRHITAPGNAEELTAAVRRWGGRHGTAVGLMALPAVVGLVPMPAGALFSAPFVRQMGAHIDGSDEWRSAVNYWFRHIWEYWWPLYPGVIVAMSLFQMDTRVFMAVQFPFTLVAVGAGYGFLIRRHTAGASLSPTPAAGHAGRDFMTVLPLLIVIVALFVFTPLLDRAMPAVSTQIRKMSAVLAGLALAFAVVLVDNFMRGRANAAHKTACPLAAVFTRKSMGVLLTLGGVLVFKHLLTTSGLLPHAAAEMADSGVPPAVAVAGLPFLAGMVTGIAVGFTGVSFPLVVGLLSAEGSGLTPLATLALAYGFGYMGMMLSPVHLCLLVTRDYFGSRLSGILRLIAPCVLTVALYTIAAYVTLSWLDK